MIIGTEFWVFKVKCTQYGICGQVAFKNARVFFILESDRMDNNCRLGSPKNKIWQDYLGYWIAGPGLDTPFLMMGSWLGQLGPPMCFISYKKWSSWKK